MERFATQRQNFAAVSRLKGEEEALVWFDAEGTKFAPAQVSKREEAEHVNRRSDELGYAHAGPSTEFCFVFAARIGLELDRYSLIVAAVGTAMFMIVYHGWFAADILQYQTTTLSERFNLKGEMVHKRERIIFRKLDIQS